jgi:hypothetical protein
MVKETFVEVYEVNLKFCYLHILWLFFHVDLKIFNWIYRLKKEGVTHLKVTIKK